VSSWIVTALVLVGSFWPPFLFMLMLAAFFIYFSASSLPNEGAARMNESGLVERIDQFGSWLSRLSKEGGVLLAMGSTKDEHGKFFTTFETSTIRLLLGQASSATYILPLEARYFSPKT
jgi:hypothetical protein